MSRKSTNKISFYKQISLLGMFEIIKFTSTREYLFVISFFLVEPNTESRFVFTVVDDIDGKRWVMFYFKGAFCGATRNEDFYNTGKKNPKQSTT